MPTWSPGDKITADKLNLTSVFVEDTTTSTTLSTTYVNSSRLLSLSLTAPASGRIETILAVRCDNSTDGSNTLSDLSITGSSSGTIYSPNDIAACQWNHNLSAGPFSTARQVTCIPGETITVAAQHRVVSGTGNFRYRSITGKALA
jgi:hypothetical protein